MTIIKTVKKVLDKVSDIALTICMTAMAVVVFWQVFSRFVINNPSFWSEELARYLMIWTTFIGAAVCVRDMSHMEVTFIPDLLLKKRIPYLIIRLIAYVFMLALGYFFFRYGMDYAKMGVSATAPTIQLRMNYIYMIIPISGVIIIVNVVEKIIEEIYYYKHPETRPEKTYK